MDVHHLSEKLAKPIWEQLPDISAAKLEKTALLELDFLKYIDDRKHLFYNKDLITYSIIRYGECLDFKNTRSFMYSRVRIHRNNRDTFIPGVTLIPDSWVRFTIYSIFLIGTVSSLER